ncbi:MAG: branched-chain amino acid aminotransferase [Saprospirales bacterium]|nr:branched-chain amino acid aminotransferase [Saprospirales bacterium]MBK8492512.1 branched-chain amino acid aminotransferase [Saprospirales bacterium]
MKYTIKVTRTTKSRISDVDFDNIPFGRLFSDHMFIAEYINGEWVNPRIEPFAPFSINPASMGLHYGQNIFEGMKASVTQDGDPLLFRPEMHARRFNRSAARMCMPAVPEELFLEGLHQLVGMDKNWIPPREGSALYIRPFMFANDEFIGVKTAQVYKFMIITGPVGPYYARPVSLLAESQYIRAARGGVGEAKAAGNYGAAMLPSKNAQDKGYDQILWLDGRDFKFVQEVGTMNIFFVIDGVVVTPSTEDGTILRGITRDSILQLLPEMGYKVQERPLSIDEIVNAYHKGTLQECFGAGTAAVVAHVDKIAYKDLVMELPKMEDRKVGEAVKNYINGLRAGKIEDTKGWIVPVKMEATVG